jgi:succinoglycan biosynthesis protein ExoA
MPIRNEAEYISRSLGAVLDQDYPRERLEVLIADGRSTDGTRKIAAQVAGERLGVSVHIIDNPEQIVPTGFNRAFAQACGEIIIRVDGHTVIAPDYVRQCVAALADSKADCVGGRMNAIGQTPVGEAIALATSSRFGVGGGRFHYSSGEEWVETVYMGAWPRKVFERVGLFDERFGCNEDDEFAYRLRKNGGKILLSPYIKSHYYNRDNLIALWRQYFSYGYWKVRVMCKHLRQMRMDQFFPVLFVGTLLGSGVLAPVSSWSGWLFTLVGGTYALANLAATLMTGGQHRAQKWLPLVFATLHISYGSGFMAGLLAALRPSRP